MKCNTPEIQQAAIAKFALLVDEFTEMFAARSSSGNADVLDLVEKDWGELRKKSDKVLCEMVGELLDSVDEKDLIAKKNRMARTGDKVKNGQVRTDLHNDDPGGSDVFADSGLLPFV
jgi:hypothetical protein